MPVQACALSRRAEAGPSNKGLVGCGSWQSNAATDRPKAGPSSYLMDSPVCAVAKHSPPSLPLNHLLCRSFGSSGLLSPCPRLRAFLCKDARCTSAWTSSPSMTTSCSDCARKVACEMAAHPHRSPGAAAGRPAAHRPSTRIQLLIAAQWLLTLFGIFCLIGAAVVIALTPEAWPL